MPGGTYLGFQLDLKQKLTIHELKSVAKKWRFLSRLLWAIFEIFDLATLARRHLKEALYQERKLQNVGNWLSLRTVANLKVTYRVCRMLTGPWVEQRRGCLHDRWKKGYESFQIKNVSVCWSRQKYPSRRNVEKRKQTTTHIIFLKLFCRGDPFRNWGLHSSSGCYKLPVCSALEYHPVVA